MGSGRQRRQRGTRGTVDRHAAPSGRQPHPTALGRVRWTVVLPLGAGLLVQFWMAYDYFVADPLYPYLEPTPSVHGHNARGVLGPGVIGVALELCAYLALVRPWQMRCSHNGTAAFAVLALAWTVVAGLFAFEAGGVAFIHLAWMLALDLFVVGLLGVLLVRRFR